MSEHGLAQLLPALQRFLDSEAAIEDFDERVDDEFATTGYQMDDDDEAKAEALVRERTLALASLRDYDPLNGIFGAVLHAALAKDTGDLDAARLRVAAQELIEAWDRPASGYERENRVTSYIHRLRAALAPPS